jgi:hypothetical protein
MAHVNFGFKLSYNREYYIQQSIERLRTMRTTYDPNSKQSSTKTTVYDHTSKIEFDLESEIVFKPTSRDPYTESSIIEILTLVIYQMKIRSGVLTSISKLFGLRHRFIVYLLQRALWRI